MDEVGKENWIEGGGMSGPYTNIRGKIEDVVFDFVQSSNGLNIPVYRAAEVVGKNEEISIPCVSVICTNTQPQMPDIDSRSAAQNRACSVEVVVISDTSISPNGFTVRNYHDAIVGQIMDLLHETALVDLLNSRNIAGIGISQVDLPSQEFTVRGNNYETTLAFTVNAYPKLQ